MDIVLAAAGRQGNAPHRAEGCRSHAVTERDISSIMMTMGLEELRNMRVRDFMGEPFPTVYGKHE
jgi:predicted transcriptional regulator